ncbi:MAG: dephospho-CoA kinase [Clostridia bacterium]|nr:dephospho-CoA kinase [Clostridia bacterium]
MKGQLVLGITGGSGSGKSQVCKLLASMGAHIIDADEIGHEVTARSDVLREIEVAFGSEVIKEDGTLNRKALGEVVFSSKEALETLNIITHKKIYDEIELQLKEAGSDIVAIDAAVLKQTRLKDLCDFVVAVVAPINQRVQRIMQRDALSEQRALDRINSQPTDAQYAHGVDFVILNNGNVENLNRRVIEIFETIRDE